MEIYELFVLIKEGKSGLNRRVFAPHLSRHSLLFFRCLKILLLGDTRQDNHNALNTIISNPCMKKHLLLYSIFIG